MTKTDRNIDRNAASIVLVVDDNPTNLGVLFDLLGNAGLKMLVATDGESAIAQIAYAKPDLILLDVMMPGIDGFETCRRLKANVETADIPVIFMTALSETPDKVLGFGVGAVDYITKPIEHEEVLVRIETHLTIRNLQKTLQQQNLSLQKEIGDRKRAEEALRIFLHAVSHDLRNPVTGMLLLLQRLLGKKEKETGSTPQTIPVPVATLERMLQSSDRQLNLINSLLESHANDIQGLVLHRKPHSLRQLAQDAIADLESLLIRDRANLRNAIPSDLPFVSADPTQIGRVFQNLISNALKYNPPGIDLIVDASVELGDLARLSDYGETSNIAVSPVILCTIEDKGVGMTPEQCEHLFELYKRGSQDGRSVSLGLGLYICRQIIETHNGSIGVRSTPDRGSTFWFKLPIAAPN